MSNKGGRPPHKPTDENRTMVRMMVVGGITTEAVARCVGISLKTLLKHYGEEIATSKPRAIAAVAGSLYNKAISKTHNQAVTAAIFFLKTQAGWKDVNHHEVAGTGGGAIQHQHSHKFDWSGLQGDEPDIVRAILSRRAAQPD